MSSRGWVKEEYLQRILKARVYDVAINTPLQEASTMGLRLGNRILLKREDLQSIFSFKLRGAYNKLANLSEEAKRNGIVACSAGNHAQGVALAATKLGIDHLIIMPAATPKIKYDAVKKMGGNALLYGASYDEAAARAHESVRTEGRTLIHPFDDPDVIAGQGTIAMEILQQLNGQPLDAIFVCCGGGGMLAGISAYVKNVRPEVRVIGVEAEDAACMTMALRAGHPVLLDSVGGFADGAAVRLAGKETFRVCREYVDEMVTVTTDEICAAIKHGFEDTRTVLEPAGALGIAGVEKYIGTTNQAGQTFVVIASGANVDFDRLRFVSARAARAESLLAVKVPEQPGAFRTLYSTIFPRRITEFSYRMHSQGDNQGQQADILLGFQAASDEDRHAVQQQLAAASFEVTDLSHDDVTKEHGRHMCGGPSAVANELLYRFEFPEQPDELKRFLDSMHSGWNVSLWHYRYSGGVTGSVLAGFQVPPETLPQFHAFLRELGLPYKEESTNELYAQFLKVGQS